MKKCDVCKQEMKETGITVNQGGELVTYYHIECFEEEQKFYKKKMMREECRDRA